MSIYCSQFGLGDEHKDACPRIRVTGRMSREQDDSKRCTCADTPLKYQGSHVLPSKRDERNGNIGFATIPPHITRKWPYLRFHVNRDTVILTRTQAKKLRDALTYWIQETHA